MHNLEEMFAETVDAQFDSDECSEGGHLMPDDISGQLVQRYHNIVQV